MLLIKHVFFFINFLCFIKYSFSECRQSYATICDSFKDLQNYFKIGSISELIIGSDHHNDSNFESVHLMNTLRLSSFRKLTSLTVLRKINKLESTYAYECTYSNSPLKYVNFFGNEMKNIEEYHFPVFDANKFSLVNNKIESISSGAFTHHAIVEIDLSDNLMEVIEPDALPSTSATKIITIENNKLTHIEPGSFPQSLKSLNLNKNKLRHLLKEILAHLTNLTELVLSNNKFNVIPDVNHLKQLVVFDISSNDISAITPKTFAGMDNLRLLDLSNNHLANSNILLDINSLMKNPTLTISLALNRLRFLNLEYFDLQEQQYILYGNPWGCDIWTTMKKDLEKHESECYSKFLANATAPYCVNYNIHDYNFDAMWNQDIDRLRQTVKVQANSFGCDLNPQRTDWLPRIGFGCVA